MSLEAIDDKKFLSHFLRHLSNDATRRDDLLKLKEGKELS
jgi:hypothetical protein